MKTLHASVALTTGVGAVLGLAIVLGLRPDVRPAEAPGQLARLQAELEDSRREQRQLRDEIGRLWAHLADPAPGAGEPAPDAAEEAEGAASAATEPLAADAASPEDRPWFNGEALDAIGLAAHRVERLRQRFAEQELAKLYLRDLAVRENWQGKPRYAKELQDLRDALRDELGEDDFDCMLYAAGRPNRIRVQEVLGGSPAESAGFEAGDLVLAYEGSRVFGAKALMDATTLGRPGASTAIRILRGDDERQLYAPRGPLGIRLSAARRPCS